MLDIIFVQIILLWILLRLVRYRGVGLMDMSSIYIVLRLVPLTSTAIWISSSVDFGDTPTLMAFSSLAFYILILTLLFPRSSSKVRYRNTVSDETVKVALNCIIAVIVVKIFIVIATLDSVPLFSHISLGSDAYIFFDKQNKWISTLKIALDNIELFLLVFYWSSIHKKKTKLVLIFISLVFTLIWLKKGALLSWAATLVIAEYLSIRLIKGRVRVFTTRRNLLFLLLIAVIWSMWVFGRSHEFIIGNVLDAFILLQSKLTFIFSQPLTLMTGGNFDAFIDSYHVDKSIYFIHSITTVFGYPAFDLGPGVAIANWLTGNDQGNGINPTFLIEGYIVFSEFAFVYAIIVALIQIAIFRFVIYNKNPSVSTMIMVAILYPLSFSIALDSSLALKRLIMGSLALFVLYFLSRLLAHVKFSSGNIQK